MPIAKSKKIAVRFCRTAFFVYLCGIEYYNTPITMTTLCDIRPRRMAGHSKRLLLLMLVLGLLIATPIDAKGRKASKRVSEAAPTEHVDTVATDTIASDSVGRESGWVNTRSDDYLGVMLNVWSDIDLSRCLDDYRVVKVEITDSLEANKEPDESISFYEPSLYTLTRLMNYQKFHPQGYSPRLTIYFYAAAALFLLMLIFWLIKSFIVSPFKKKTV